jgi:hypothetical protein
MKIKNLFFEWLENLTEQTIANFDKFEISQQSNYDIQEIFESQSLQVCEEMCETEDITLMNCQTKLTCILCQQ